MAEADVTRAAGAGRRPARRPSRLTAVIIGAGVSGLLAGVRLKRAGIHSFVILERAESLGGTWFENSYPGAACDVPSHLYSYSFAPNPGWTSHYARQPEILAYLKDTARGFGLMPHIALKSAATAACFDETSGLWTVEAADGRCWTSRILIVATGQFNQPHIPDVPGRADFGGPQFHSARWNHEVPLAGKRVGVVGTGASAAQIVPAIQPAVERLTLFQRSAAWVVPRLDHGYQPATRALFRFLPVCAKLLRLGQYVTMELRFFAFRHSEGRVARRIRAIARQYLETEVKDPMLRAKLTPDYPVGCKRVVISSDFYAALGRPNVALETGGIARVTADGAETADGRHIPLDVLIWATGFEAARFPVPLRIEGLAGRRLDAQWAQAPEAHRGVTIAGFPNMVMLFGPNTKLGHNSAIYMAERQMDYAMRLIETLLGRDLLYLDISAQAQASYNNMLQAELARTVWAGNCHSWYKNEAGRIVTNWPSFSLAYGWQMRRFDIDNYRLVPRPVPATVAA